MFKEATVATRKPDNNSTVVHIASTKRTWMEHMKGVRTLVARRLPCRCKADEKIHNIFGNNPISLAGAKLITRNSQYFTCRGQAHHSQG